MSLEKFIDDQIKKAIAEGDFIDLPGRGKPVDLRAYFATPEDLRMCYSILKQANFVPEEVGLLQEIEELRDRRKAAGDEMEKATLTKVINEKTLVFRTALERRRRAG
jgi:hypothetical protein